MMETTFENIVQNMIFALYKMLVSRRHISPNSGNGFVPDKFIVFSCIYFLAHCHLDHCGLTFNFCPFMSDTLDNYHRMQYLLRKKEKRPLPRCLWMICISLFLCYICVFFCISLCFCICLFVLCAKKSIIWTISASILAPAWFKTVSIDQQYLAVHFIQCPFPNQIQFGSANNCVNFGGK